VVDSEGNVLESSASLRDLAFWIEPEALAFWDTLIPTPEELCDCQNDFPFGEEEDDGSYLADEWSFSLYMEGDGDPQRDYLQAIGMALRGGEVVGIRYKVIPVPEGARPQVIYKEAPSTCQRGRGRWILSWSLPDGSSLETELLLEAPPFEEDVPPPRAMEHHWLEWWDVLEQGCKATPYVAEGLKVTKWLDFAAEMAMGFLPCGDVGVLVKRYWMGQEVTWVEWSSAVLSCLPVLGKVGGLALRGIAGAAKWFLKSRRLRHLAEGAKWLDDARRLHRRFAGWLTRFGGNEAHHIWPIYLGGEPQYPTIEIPRRLHRRLHSLFDQQFPDLRRNRFPRPSRRGFCELYHGGQLTYEYIWNALNQFYEGLKNHEDFRGIADQIYDAWRKAYTQDGKLRAVQIFRCQNWCLAGLPCGGR